MVKNYLKSALRSLLKYRVQSLLSILSITIGLAVSTLIFLYVQDEFRYDAYHTNADRIYRLANNWKGGDEVTPWARTSTPMAPAILSEFPEVEKVVRVRKNPRTDLLANGEKKFYEPRLYFADPEIFEVFTFPLKVGNAPTALSRKNTIVLTERMARKYFGDEDPIGKLLRYDNQYDLEVTGILKEVPSNSHFRFDLLADFETAKDVLGEGRTQNWFWFDIQTYLLLNESADVSSLEEKFPGIIEKNVPEQYAAMFDLFLQPLTSIHLTSDLKDELEMNSQASYSYILLTVAMFIMLMACVNFINQTTANFANRSAEIGVRKVFGAHRSQLALQYLMEAILITMIALGFALILVLIVLPNFNELTDKEIRLFTSNNLLFLSGLVLFTLIIGLISGSYPAIYLSNLSPLKAIGGAVNPGGTSKYLRSTLVTLQICVSLVLIISTLVVSRQLNYFQTTNFGFDKEYLVIVPIKDRGQNNRHNVLTTRLEDDPNVLSATLTSSVPGSANSMSFYYRPVDSGKDAQRIATFLVDDNFVRTFDLNKVMGLDLSIDQKEDTIQYIIVNESFVEFFGIEDPIGSYVQSGVTNKIIAVVEDFNIKSLHHKLEPALLLYGTNWFRYVAVKVDGNNLQKALSSIERTWIEFYPGYPFEYSFLDDEINLLYASEQKMSTIFNFFSGIAILIASLGLVSLASFIVSKRTREIGIRKVLGSSVNGIVFLFARDFLILVLVAIIVGAPLTYLLMNEWLASFAFRISITPAYFILPTIMILILLIVTVGYQVIKASLLNPVDTLRYE